MTLFAEIPIETNAAAIEQDVYDYLATEFPGWEPSAGGLEVFMVKALSFMAADLAEIAVRVPPEIFNQFGRKIIGIPPIEAASATVNSTWTMVDAAGYTIPAGTVVGIQAAADTVYGFTVVDTAIVPTGQTATTAGEVLLRATVPGEDPNGLTATPELLDALVGVDSIALVGETSGGVNAEDPDVYLNRLAAEMQLLTPRPILPRDAEVLARRIAGVARALAIDGYNPADETLDNERMVTVAVVDENGDALSSGVKAAVDALLQDEREVNFIFHIVDPDFNDVSAHVEAVARAGHDTATVAADVEAAVTAYLDPATWGTPPDSLPLEFLWEARDAVRVNEVVSLVDAVIGVDYVTLVELAIGSAGLTAADLALDGIAPLTRPDTITATISPP